MPKVAQSGCSVSQRSLAQFGPLGSFLWHLALRVLRGGEQVPIAVSSTAPHPTVDCDMTGSVRQRKSIFPFARMNAFQETVDHLITPARSGTKAAWRPRVLGTIFHDRTVHRLLLFGPYALFDGADMFPAMVLHASLISVIPESRGHFLVNGADRLGAKPCRQGVEKLRAKSSSTEVNDFPPVWTRRLQSIRLPEFLHARKVCRMPKSRN